ncbi:ribosomal protein S5 domain 2-type protein [Podospora australis]|uniref:Small ribosomal subunit protein uS9m n=1 Tax=Podospora australis TaxID=1536484 RepID=A0AAN6WZQ5_9PEZI|nr:ribosomal protein S5 domain 2-type protein [Podospora australis]
MASTTRHGLTSALRGVPKTLYTRQTQSLQQQFQSLRLSESAAVTNGCRCLTTEAIKAAPEVDLEALKTRKVHEVRHARAIPASPGYFSRVAKFNDTYIALEKLLAQYGNLPTIPATEVERVQWRTYSDFATGVGEKIRLIDYKRCLAIVKRLNQIHPKLKPAVVKTALESFKREIQAYKNVPKPIPIDKFGRALGVGKRKSSSARAFLVEGNGEVLVNGKTLAEYFGRVHDRESAIWALHATGRADKYNVWARVDGGGTTGQAEALTLAISKALMAHEPALKPALRRAGCVTRDPRRVERKKHGHLKARKSPTWVKR